MKLEIDFEKFLDRISYYEYLREVSTHMNHHVDSYLIETWREKIRKRPSRKVKGDLGKLYRIITVKNFEINAPINFATNPAARIENDKIKLIVRVGSSLFERTYLAICEVNNFDFEKADTKIFIPCRHPGESLEDPRMSNVDDSILFVSVLFVPGLQIYPGVITWYLKNNKVAPIMYKDIVLSDNRDTFPVTEKIMAIRPTSKFLGKAMILLGHYNDNVIDDVFTYDFLYPGVHEEKTGGGCAVKVEKDLYMLVFHGIYRGELIHYGLYLNYAILVNREGELLGYIDEPLHPANYLYSGRRPCTIFASSCLVLDNPEKYLPKVGEFIKDYDKVFVLLCGIDDEAIGIFVEDLDKILEKVKWIEKF